MAFDQSSSQVQDTVARILKDTSACQNQRVHILASSIETRKKLIDTLRSKDVPVLGCRQEICGMA